MKNSMYFMTLIITLSSQARHLPSLEKNQALQNGGWVLQTGLSMKSAGSQEGYSVALSADGNSLAAGAFGYNNYAGATQIYIRSGTVWNYQATLSQGISNSLEGVSVALSEDGNTLAVGAVGPNNYAGATQIYIRSGTTWYHQATLSQGISNSEEGASVSLSADGNTLAAGAPFSFPAKTQIYVRSGTTWNHQATLTQWLSDSREGLSVALSANGNTFATGDIQFNHTGAAQIYARSGTAWNHQATLTQGISSNEGSSVALSEDGNILAVGASAYNMSGATQIYIQSGTTWNHQATLSQGISNSLEGFSESLSSDGNTLAAGAPFIERGSGETQIYVRSGTTWSHQATLSQGISNSLEGLSVALSADGNTLAAGAENITDQAGGTFLYVNK